MGHFRKYGDLVYFSYITLMVYQHLDKLKGFRNSGFALALKKLSPSLSPNGESWGQPRDSLGQILRSWGQMNNRKM